MKKILLFILGVTMSIVCYSQEVKKIALLEPRTGEGSTSVTGMEKAMIRGELRKAIVSMTGYEAITRGDIDQMMKEQDFQRTGMVNDAQIKKMGEMSGADYICVSTLTKSNTEFYLEAYLIQLETGRMSNPASQYGELVDGKLGNMLPICEVLAQELLGVKVERPAPAASTAQKQTQKTATKPAAQSKQQAQEVAYEETTIPGAKEYNVYAFGVYGVVGYFANTEYDGAIVEYRILYKSKLDVPDFQYLGTAPFAYVNPKAYDNALLAAFRPIMVQKTLVVPDAKDVAKIEFRLSKEGYKTVVTTAVKDVIIGGGPVLMISMNKLKPL